MKKIILSMVVAVMVTASYAQENAKVYFIRPYNYSGSMIKFRCFADETLLCALKNAKYSMHDVAPGDRNFYLQPYKDDLKKEKASTLKKNLESGKSYYFTIIWTPLIQFVELDSETGSSIVKNMKLQSDCKID
jgi:hypothetical protein